MFAVEASLLLITMVPVLPSLLSVLLFSGNSLLLPLNSQRSCSGRRVRLRHCAQRLCCVPFIFLIRTQALFTFSYSTFWC